MLWICFNVKKHGLSPIMLTVTFPHTQKKAVPQKGVMITLFHLHSFSMTQLSHLKDFQWAPFKCSLVLNSFLFLKFHSTDWDNYFHAGILQKAIGVGIGMLNIRAQAKKLISSLHPTKLVSPLGPLKKIWPIMFNFFLMLPWTVYILEFHSIGWDNHFHAGMLHKAIGAVIGTFIRAQEQKKIFELYSGTMKNVKTFKYSHKNTNSLHKVRSISVEHKAKKVQWDS